MPAIKQIYAVKKVRFRSDYYSFANVRIERPRSNWFRNDNPDNCQSGNSEQTRRRRNAKNLSVRDPKMEIPT